MDKINLIKYLIAFLLVTLSLVGLNASMYSWRTKKFYLNYFLVFWCITAFSIFTSVYVSLLYNEIIAEGLDLKSAFQLFYYINILGAVINYLSQLVHCKAAIDLYNQAKLLETIKDFDIEIGAIKSAALLVTLKSIIFPTIIEILLILKQLHDDIEASKSLLLTIYVLYPLIAANIIPNCLFGAFVVCRELTLVLNRDLSKLEKEANCLQSKKQMHLHKHFYRMQKFCHLADKLDELSAKYSAICSQILSYVSLVSIPLLVSLLCNLFGVTAGLFRQYYALADTIINEESYNVFDATINAVFLIISFLEIALQSLVGNQIIVAAKETGLILKRMKLEHADIRFRQAVENFSFQILVINLKIEPMRLFNIDLSLLHNVFSAVTSFLLILIQSDLTLRFSLK